MFIPLINRSTQITDHSALIIDNMFTNNLGCKHFNGIVISDISDHLPVFVYEVDEAEITLKNRQTKYVTVRDFSERNKSNFGSLFLVLTGIHISMKAILMNLIIVL